MYLNDEERKNSFNTARSTWYIFKDGKDNLLSWTEQFESMAKELGGGRYSNLGASAANIKKELTVHANHCILMQRAINAWLIGVKNSGFAIKELDTAVSERFLSTVSQFQMQEIENTVNTQTRTVTDTPYMAGYFGGNEGVVSNNLMNTFAQYKDGSSNDYTKHKTYENYTVLTKYDQKLIQDMAKTDEVVGIRYVTVDGLTDASGAPAKVYCAAFGDIVASAASGTARCGDVVKVTWDDGTFDYMVVGDTKGGNSLGHTAGTWEKGYETTKSNAIELIIDDSVYTNDARSLRRQGTIGAYGVDYSDDVCESTENTRHWSQGFSNIEVLDINVLGK